MNRINLFQDRVVVGEWKNVSNTQFTECYMTAFKKQYNANDTIDVAKVKKLCIEIGLDTGIKNAIGIIQRVNITFENGVCDIPGLDGKLAATFIRELPKTDFSIRVASVVLDDGKAVKKGTVPVGVAFIFTK